MFIWGAVPATESAPAAAANRAVGKRKYRRCLSLVAATVERMRDDLAAMRQEAEVYYATHDAAWQEGPEGMRYLAALGEISALGQALGELPVVDAGVLR